MENKDYEEELEENIVYNHDIDSTLHRRHRKGDRMHKILPSSDIESVSKTTRILKKDIAKHKFGKTLKIKGKTRPSLWTGNSRCEKSWETITGKKLPPNKAFALFLATY